MENYISKYSFEELQENFNKLNSTILDYFKSTNDEYWIDKANKLIKLHEDLADKVMLAPASSSPSLHAAYIGGYVIHTLNVIKASILTYKLWKHMGINVNDTMLHELVFCAATHDLGKVGNLSEDYYVQETSKWHIEHQLKYFKKNIQIPFMRLQDRTLWLLQKYQIDLSENEYITILVHDGLFDEGNKTYYTQYEANQKFTTSVPYMLHHADMLSTRLEFEQWYIPYIDELLLQNTKSDVEATIQNTAKAPILDDDRKQQLTSEFSKLFKGD